MKKTHLVIIIIFILLLNLISCEDPCNGVISDQIGGEFFTIEYRDPSGTNYLESIYNLNGIIVFVDLEGGESTSPKYELISPGYEEGKFGPFNFTESFIQETNQAVNGPALYGNPMAFDYYIKKDTIGQDTLRVEFLVGVDGCRQYWDHIRYFLNGDPLSQYENQRQAEILIVE